MEKQAIYLKIEKQDIFFYQKWSCDKDDTLGDVFITITWYKT